MLPDATFVSSALNATHVMGFECPYVKGHQVSGIPPMGNQIIDNQEEEHELVMTTHIKEQ